MGFVSVIYRLVKNKYATVGVPAIIINKKGYILLGKRNKKAVFYPGYWGLPGGLVAYGEKMEDAIKREIKEELGADAEVIKKSDNVYERLPSKECKIHCIDIPHYCKLNNAPKAEDETKEVRWFKPEEIKNMELAYTHKEILTKEGLI